MNKRILLIEDDYVLLECYHQILSKFGYTVFPHSSVEKGIEFLQSSTIDLIISDIHFGGMNGNELIEFVKNFNFILIPPIIFVTGSVDITDAFLVLNDLVGEVLIKPVSISDLISAIKRYI